MFSEFQDCSCLPNDAGPEQRCELPHSLLQEGRAIVSGGNQRWGVTSVRRRTEALERGHVNFHWRVLLPCNKSNRCSALHPRMAWSICQVGKVSLNSFGAGQLHLVALVLTIGTPGMDACRRRICGALWVIVARMHERFEMLHRQ